MNERIQGSMPKFFDSEEPVEIAKTNKKGKPANLPPIENDLLKEDLKFIFSNPGLGHEAPTIQVPEQDKKLFVTKPLGRYEPVDDLNEKVFNPDPNVRSKPLPSRPKSASRNVMREIHQTLDGHMLKKIHAGPKIIDFKEMFIKSSSEKFFSVRNDMKHAISARLILEDEQIALSYD